MTRNWRPRRKHVWMLATGAVLMQVIPAGCSQNILHIVTPWLLNGTSNVLDTIVKAVAPLVLP